MFFGDGSRSAALPGVSILVFVELALDAVIMRFGAMIGHGVSILVFVELALDELERQLRTDGNPEFPMENQKKSNARG